jgi:hypothetical protein
LEWATTTGLRAGCMECGRRRCSLGSI